MAVKKILVVLTGGTIGSAINDNTINVSSNSTFRLIQAYEDKYADGQSVKDEFEIVQPYTILSENTTLSTWTKLCRFLSGVDFDNYSGIIIAHGTDTYSYTAALLGMLYDEITDIPVVLVSSNYAIGEPLSNGLDNFRNAVCFIRDAYAVDCTDSGSDSGLIEAENKIKSDFKGVFCIYEDKFGVNQVYKAREIMEADTCIDQFSVFGGEVYGEMLNGKFIKNEAHVDRCRVDLPQEFSRAKQPEEELTSEEKAYNNIPAIEFNREVIMLKTYPGLNYDYINISRDAKSENEGARRVSAVVVNLYHSATSCVLCDRCDEGNSFVRFADRCKKEGIKLYAAGFKKSVKDEYASMKVYNETDAIKLYDISPEAAYAYALIMENFISF